MPKSFISDITVHDNGGPGSELAGYTVCITRVYPDFMWDNDNHIRTRARDNISPASIGRVMRCLGQFVTWGVPFVLHNNVIYLAPPLP
jgi:hypothetical protein